MSFGGTKRPLPGRQYIVKAGDTVAAIAAKAYGDANLADRISEANQLAEGEQLLQDQIILIPNLPEDQTLKTNLVKSVLPNQGKYDLALVIGGISVQTTAVRARLQMDTASDGWTATIPWTPGADAAIDGIVRPYTYPEASLYIGGKLLINGLLYVTGPRMASDGVAVDLKGWSYSVDAVDSTLSPPYERSGETLRDTADFLVRPLGIKAVFDVDPGEPFKRMSAEPSETIFAHLAKYAAQRGFLISSTPAGDLLFLRADTSGKQLGTITETDPIVSSWQAEYDGRKLFNIYRVIGQSPGFNAKSVTVTDSRVPRSRFLTFSADDTTTGDIQQAALWRRSKQLADALTLPLTVNDWYSPSGELWTPNRMVTVVSRVLGLAAGYSFLIRSVEFSEAPDSGQTAKLDLVPPQVYTGEQIAYPW